MPFGLTNAPAVFQRLMQNVLSGLNPESGRQFVAAYLDDILVFYTTLQDHLIHLRKVIDRLKSVHLKLKPAKCMFARREVEYLGHVISAEGLRPNPRITEVVQNYPRPENVVCENSLAWHPTTAGFVKIATTSSHCKRRSLPMVS